MIGKIQPNSTVSVVRCFPDIGDDKMVNGNVSRSQAPKDRPEHDQLDCRWALKKPGKCTSSAPIARNLNFSHNFRWFLIDETEIYFVMCLRAIVGK